MAERAPLIIDECGDFCRAAGCGYALRRAKRDTRVASASAVHMAPMPGRGGPAVEECQPLAYCCGRCGAENSGAVAVWLAREDNMRISVAVDDILAGRYEYVRISRDKTLSCRVLQHIYAEISSRKSLLLRAADVYSTGVATNILEALDPRKSPARNRRARREAVAGALRGTDASGFAPTLTGKSVKIASSFGRAFFGLALGIVFGGFLRGGRMGQWVWARRVGGVGIA
jgi:hypothetical protein